MAEILENTRRLLPFLVLPWATVLVLTFWKPQSYFNSMLLMLACVFTMFFVCGLFGEYMSTALLVCMVLIALVLLAVPVLLIINGLQVVKKECFSLPHLLSLLLGVVIFIGEIATVAYVLGTSDYIPLENMHLLTMAVSGTVIYFSVLVLNFVVYTVFIQILPHRMRFDYVIIHGCGLIDGHKMSRLLSNRVDKAIEIYHKCKVKPMLIPSGGRGSDEDLSEAEAMKQYLLAHGIPEKHILPEDRSATTMENLQFSKELIFAREGKRRTALVSSNYHIYRCLTYAKKVGLRCTGIGAKVAFYFWPSALIREFVAIFLTPKFFIWSMLGYVTLMSPVLLLFAAGYR